VQGCTPCNQIVLGGEDQVLFLVATPLAALALVVVLFIREKPLKTTSGAQRLAEEQAAAPLH
jgi:hypothetical protein